MNETEVLKIVDKLKETENKEEFLSSFEKWLTSMVDELRKQGKTEEEVGKTISEQCYKIGATIGSELSDQDLYIKDLLSSALLELFVELKHRK